jgi:hypothetical protein
VVNRYVCDDAEDSGCKWRKSSWSYGSGECIEVAAPSGKRIAVRDSKNVHGAVLSFNSAQWNAFIASIHGGKFGRVRRKAQQQTASTGPAPSSMSRPGAALGGASLQAVSPVVVGTAGLASLYGRCYLPSMVSYA